MESFGIVSPRDSATSSMDGLLEFPWRACDLAAHCKLKQLTRAATEATGPGFTIESRVDQRGQLTRLLPNVLLRQLWTVELCSFSDFRTKG
jgi:hypothetical protein